MKTKKERERERVANIKKKYFILAFAFIMATGNKNTCFQKYTHTHTHTQIHTQLFKSIGYVLGIFYLLWEHIFNHKTCHY